MSKDMEEIKELAEKLKILKANNPNKYYEFKGRIDAIYETEKEKEAI